MPESRAEIAATVHDGRLYVAGGIDVHAVSLTTFEAFDQATNTWTTLAPLPEGRDHVGLAALGGKIYLSGGAIFVRPEVRRDLWVCDPATDAWNTSLPALTTYDEHLAGVVVDGRAWIIGGRHFSNLATVKVYDPGTNAWTSMPDMPTARGGLTAGSWSAAGATVESPSRRSSTSSRRRPISRAAARGHGVKCQLLCHELRARGPAG